MKLRVICITGTPGVGKTTLSKRLKESLNGKLIKISKLAQKRDLFIGEDPIRGYKIVDIPSLCREIRGTIDPHSINIVESHLSHYCKICDIVIVLRLYPGVLKKRLEERGYPMKKIKENVEAEALGVCAYEAYELHKKNVHEIDTTKLSVTEILKEILGVINGEKPCKVGIVDFMGWFLKEGKVF